MQKFKVTGQIEDGKLIDVTVTGWRELQKLLSIIREDGSYTETRVTIEVNYCAGCGHPDCGGCVMQYVRENEVETEWHCELHDEYKTRPRTMGHDIEVLCSLPHRVEG